jgi:hypothetical protein
MLHLELCAVSKQDRLAGAKVAASAVDGATKRVPRLLKATPSNDRNSVTLALIFRHRAYRGFAVRTVSAM